MRSKIYSAILSITFLLFTTVTFQAKSQCFQIKSILVDACGSPEGANEMVRFEIGSTPLNTADLTVTWPNGSYNGICQDAGTALKTDSLNQSVQGCGLLIEPTSGILPAGVKVLLITSTDMSASSNSFASLNDTLYIIYQCAGNTSGHFANYNPTPGLRTLVMQFSSPANCLDSVTYDRSLSINQNGTQGGSSAINDGAFVNFDAAGNATYLNNGCQALINPLVANAGPDLIYCGSPLTLNGSTTGVVNSIQWTTASGNLSNASSLITDFTPTPGLTGMVTVTLNATGACSVVSTDTVHVFIPVSNPAAILSANGNILACNILSFNYTYNWSLNGTPLSSVTGPFYNATASGCYEVTVSDVNGCSVSSDTVCLIVIGIEEMQNNVAVTVSQSNQQVHLQLQSGKALNNFNISIYDVAGKLIQSSSHQNILNDFQLNLDASALSQQVYYINIIGDKFVKNIPVMIQK